MKVPLPKVKHFHNESTTTSIMKDTIELTYRTISIELLNKSLRLKNPLKANFYSFPVFLEKQKAEAEAERKEKARKLSFDEAIKLTSEKFQHLCDFSLWEQFVSSRSMTAKTKLTKNALNVFYKDFVKWGYDGSNESLKSSIAGNYQGLFAPKQQFAPSQQNQKSTRWDEIQELIKKEEQDNDSYGF